MKKMQVKAPLSPLLNDTNSPNTPHNLSLPPWRTGHYEVHADLPGVDASDLDITVDNNQIEIKAMRRHIHDVDTDTIHVRSIPILQPLLPFLYFSIFTSFNVVTFIILIQVQERTFGEVKRTLRLPTDCDADNAAVEFKNSVLTISFPKKETGKRKLAIMSK